MSRPIKETPVLKGEDAKIFNDTMKASEGIKINKLDKDKITANFKSLNSISSIPVHDEQREKDLQVVCDAVIDLMELMDVKYPKGHWCSFCDAHCDHYKSIPHKPDCAYLIAKELKTKPIKKYTKDKDAEIARLKQENEKLISAVRRFLKFL